MELACLGNPDPAGMKVYGPTGKVDIFPLDATGKPGERCGGADQGRKEGHCAQPKPEVAPAPPLAGADIVLTPDARHLFMSIRDVAGDTDLIASYRVAADGSLEPLPGTRPTTFPGAWPSPPTAGCSRSRTTGARRSPCIASMQKAASSG